MLNVFIAQKQEVGRLAAMATDSQIKKAFGAALKKGRELRGITQATLARHSKLTRAYIHYLERGKAGPTLNTFFKIADGLRITPQKFLQLIMRFLKRS